MPPVSFKSSSICRAPGASSCVSHFLVNLPVLQAQQHQGLLPGSLNTQSDLTPVPVGTLAAPRVRCCWGQLRPPEPGTHLQPSGDTGWWASSQPTAVAGLQLSSAQLQAAAQAGWASASIPSLVLARGTSASSWPQRGRELHSLLMAGAGTDVKGIEPLFLKNHFFLSEPNSISVH